MSNNSGSGLVAGIGCVALCGWLAFWVMILYGLYELVFKLIPHWAA